MAIVERTIIYNHETGEVVPQDVSAFVVHEESLWNNSTRPNPTQSTCTLSMRRTGSGNPIIREGFRIVNGFWDTDTNTWDRARFGGYIARSRRTQQADVLRFTLTLTDYSIYLTKRRILSWPTGPELPVTGMPAGVSVKRWLWGAAGDDGVEYPGLLTAHYTGMREDGVDGFFEFIELGEDALPGNVGEYYGVFGFCSVLEALSDILAAAAFSYERHYSGPALTPAVWVEAALAPGGLDIVPRIRIGNVADVAATPVGQVVGIDEPGGPYPGAMAIRQIYAHEREMCEANSVTVLGEGGDPTIVGNPLVYAEATTPDHDTRYLAEFSTEGRWEIVERVPQVYTIATALDTATTMETDSGAGRGSYEFSGDQYFPAGAWLDFLKSDEVVAGVFPVAGVSMRRTSTTPVYDYRVGFNVRAAREVLGGGAVQTRLTLEELNFKLGRLRTVPGRPTPTVATRHPMHSRENTFQARSYNKTLMRFQASANAPWTGDPDGTDRASLTEWWGADGKRRMHAGPDGEPRGHSLILAETVYAGPVVLNMAQAKTFIRAVESGAGGAGWTYAVNGSPVSLPFSVEDTDQLTLTPPSTTLACGLTLTELEAV